MADVDNETLLLSGALVLGGLGLIVYGFTREGGPDVPIRLPFAGDRWGTPNSPSLDPPGQISVSLSVPNPSVILPNGQHAMGAYLKVRSPYVEYGGPGRNAYSAITVYQKYGSGWAAVYGSGVAGARMFPSMGMMSQYGLVAPNQPQPDGSVGPDLWAYPWPGTSMGPVCGIPPYRGVGTLVLAVYSVVAERYEGCGQRGDCPPDSAPDYDGFASPTCSYSPHRRLAVTYRKWDDKVVFV